MRLRHLHDAERDPGHFIDIDDSGVVIGGVVPLAGLPLTREAFDTAQRTGSPAQTQYLGGYLPYQILDGFQQLRKDFGMWRAFKAGLYSAVKESDREYFRFHLALQDLPPDERKSGAEFEQEPLNVINECLLNFALSPWIGGAQEVKQVRVLEDMCCHIRLCRRQSRIEVADRFPIAQMGATLDLHH
jgi:hypothetical protein